ncbi:activating signal cointegrator 1 complex subunit [Apophysomyces ossiformis]|uniref:Activating signal cointegrator 1 complex subunit n=1 Tax=Apophysomyces ossiformis TaxID=679940 RepID=A0A8H7BNS8_9FUNG|nr:activating signal cointegrator 1 complex subunit [Apophysomyces ossiformis]
MTSVANVKNVTANITTYTSRSITTTSTESQQPEVAIGDIQTVEECLTYTYPVKRIFHGYIIGKHGNTINELKRMTGASINVSRRTDAITLKGSASAIDEAKIAIDELVKKAYKRSRPTHFLSIPISSPTIDSKVRDFQQSISFCEGVDPSILISPVNLHITLAVLKLFEPSDVESALEFLQQECPKVVQSVLNDVPLSVYLKDLAIMQSDPAAAHVLYVKAEDETLTTLGNAIIDKMVEGGYLQEDEKQALKVR